MESLSSFGSTISISIQPDEQGFLGKECPNSDCEGYFKVQPGTGLTEEGLPVHCPYCGTSAPQDQFFTKAQIEYAQSVALHQITGAFFRDLKSMEFDHRPRGGFGISLKVTGGPTPIHYYRESELETEVVCQSCTLRYAIFGVFGFCPDCGIHNSLQILQINLELIDKTLTLAESQPAEIQIKLVENCLEDCVSAFDGYGRELCRLHAGSAKNAAAAERISFQNLEEAQKSVLREFGVDIAAGLSHAQWELALASFQKRHLLAHSMGVIDQKYLNRSGDAQAVKGRKVKITAHDVRELLPVIATLGSYLSKELAGTQP